MGLFDTIGDALFGSPDAPPPSAYAGELGQEVQGSIISRMRDPAGSPEFMALATAIHENATRAAASSRQRLGQSLLERGALDSGAALSGLEGIERGKIESITQALNEALVGIHQTAVGQALPFLAGSDQATMSRFAAEQAGKQQNISNLFGLASTATGVMTGLGGLSGTGFLPGGLSPNEAEMLSLIG